MNISVCLFVGLAVLFSARAQRTPEISILSDKQIKEIGGTAEFVCTAQYIQDYPVLWLKYNKDHNDQLLISSNSALVIRDSRFSLRHDGASATYTLQIKDVQESDAGFYQCHILISISSRISSEVQLEVRKMPIISDNSTRSIVVDEGKPVKLECFADGNPTPKISWRKENNAILPNGGLIYRGNILKIPSVHKDDRGTYYCNAQNGVGKGAWRNINLEINFAPIVKASHSRVGQALNVDAHLECYVEAYPKPVIYWYREDTVGLPLSNNQHYSLSSSDAANAYTDTTLRIITVEERQYGRYICRATNQFGSAEAVVELYESDKPQCPPACG